MFYSTESNEILMLQRYFKDGKVLLPHAFGPMFGNCFLSVILNEPVARENMADICTYVKKELLLDEFLLNIFIFSNRAVEHGFVFQRKTDNYGKLYSLIENFAKYFPEWSEYRVSRDASIGLYKFFSVNCSMFHDFFSIRIQISIKYCFLFLENS